MDSVFKICKKGACGITITGLEKDNDEYLNETSEITVSTVIMPIARPLLLML